MVLGQILVIVYYCGTLQGVFFGIRKVLEPKQNEKTTIHNSSYGILIINSVTFAGQC